jgi:acyl-CoA synthetase (AMP-forming)/AMP-acid ligase II
MFNETLQRQPDSVLFVAEDRVWSFADAIADIDKMAEVLQTDYGIGAGDRVAIVAANSPEYGLAIWAAISLGAIVTSLNGWWTGPELQYGIDLTAPALLLGDERRLRRLKDVSVPFQLPVVLLADLYETARCSATRGSANRPLDAALTPDEPAVIMFTSGTTGKPKGATLSHRNIINIVWSNLLTDALRASSNGSRSPETQPASILVNPLFHVSGLLVVLMSGPAMGVKVVFPPPGRWDETRTLEMTRDHKISMWSGVPTQYRRLLQHPDFESFDLSSLATAGGGGAPFPPDLVREFRDRLPWVTLRQSYGMSETAGLGTRTGGPLIVEHPESVGVANATVEVEVRDSYGELLPAGDVGEIYLRTPSVFLGYWDDEEATRASVDDEGWYRTGDFGRITDDLLYLESRMRDMILRGGENIYPIEIEHRLVEHPDIEDAAVIGVDHRELGQEVKAFVVTRHGAEVTALQIQQWVAETLAPFKVPAYIEYRDTFPYTETGKVMKHLLESEEAPCG